MGLSRWYSYHNFLFIWKNCSDNDLWHYRMRRVPPFFFRWSYCYLTCSSKGGVLWTAVCPFVVFLWHWSITVYRSYFLLDFRLFRVFMFLIFEFFTKHDTGTKSTMMNIYMPWDCQFISIDEFDYHSGIFRPSLMMMLTSRQPNFILILFYCYFLYSMAVCTSNYYQWHVIFF